jgi:hypothetical protein
MRSPLPGSTPPCGSDSWATAAASGVKRNTACWPSGTGMNSPLMPVVVSASPETYHRHVMVPRRHIDLARIEQLAPDTLFHLSPGGARKPLRENRRENRRHVLGRESEGDATPSMRARTSGPPVELRIAMTRGGTSENGLWRKAGVLPPPSPIAADCVSLASRLWWVRAPGRAT